MPERIDDGVADRGRRADRTAFTAALDAERIAWRWGFDKGGMKRRQVGGARDTVIHEACGQKLAGVSVVDDMLPERLSDALGEAAMHLAFDNHRIDDHATIVDSVEVTKPHGSRVRVDNNDREVHCLRIVGVGWVVEFGDLEARIERTISRKRGAVIGDVCNLGEWHGSVGASHAEFSALVFQVNWGTFH